MQKTCNCVIFAEILRNDLVEMKYGAVPGQIGAADKAAKEASMHLDGYPLALDGIDFGEQPQDAGRFWAVAPDWMHVYYEGIGKDLLDWIVGLCKVYLHFARYICILLGIFAFC